MLRSHPLMFLLLVRWCQYAQADEHRAKRVAPDTKCPEPIKCQNGWQNPNKCDKCECSLFHNGALCEHEREALILPLGGTVKLNKKIMKTTKVFNKYLKPEGTPQLIKAPEGSRIRVTIEGISDPGDGWCPENCEDFGLRISDIDMADRTFCCPKSPQILPYSFDSTTNVIGWYVYAKPGLNIGVNATFTIMTDARKTDKSSTTRPATEKPSTTEPTTQLPRAEATTEKPVNSTTEHQREEPALETTIDVSSTSQPPVASTTSYQLKHTTASESVTSDPFTTLTNWTNADENSTATDNSTRSPSTEKSRMLEILDSIKSLISEVTTKINRLSELVGW